MDERIQENTDLLMTPSALRARIWNAGKRAYAAAVYKGKTEQEAEEAAAKATEIERAKYPWLYRKKHKSVLRIPPWYATFRTHPVINVLSEITGLNIPALWQKEVRVVPAIIDRGVIVNAQQVEESRQKRDKWLQERREVRNQIEIQYYTLVAFINTYSKEVLELGIEKFGASRSQGGWVTFTIPIDSYNKLLSVGWVLGIPFIPGTLLFRISEREVPNMKW